MVLRRAGFTLIELLVAATMMSVLFFGLAGYLQGGVGVWRRATQVTKAAQRERVAVNELRRDLANAIVYQTDEDVGDEILFGFSAQDMHWVTVRPATVMANAHIAFVQYYCDDAGLWRTSQRVQEVLAEAPLVPTQVLPSCDGVNFEYAYLPSFGSGHLDWHDTWISEEDLPRLVAMTAPLTEGHPSRVVMALPAGHLRTLLEE